MIVLQGDQWQECIICVETRVQRDRFLKRWLTWVGIPPNHLYDLFNWVVTHIYIYGKLAQQVEQTTVNRQALGSNPKLPAKYKSGFVSQYSQLACFLLIFCEWKNWCLWLIITISLWCNGITLVSKTRNQSSILCRLAKSPKETQSEQRQNNIVGQFPQC